MATQAQQVNAKSMTQATSAAMSGLINQTARAIEQNVKELAVYTHADDPSILKPIYNKTNAPYRRRILAGRLSEGEIGEQHDKELLNVLCCKGFRYSMSSDPVSFVIGRVKDFRYGINVPREAYTDDAVLHDTLENVCRIWYRAFDAAGKTAYIDLVRIYRPGYVHKLYVEADKLGVFELLKAYFDKGVPVEDLVG